MSVLKRKIMVAGAFDIIHLGHINFLRQAKNLYDESELIVVLARDSTIRRYKQREPVFSERERLEIVESIKFVDKAILGNELDGKTFFDIIYEVKPDVIVLGYDQNVDENKLKTWAKEKGLNVEVIRLNKFSDKDVLSSSTEVRNKILRLYCR